MIIAQKHILHLIYREVIGFYVLSFESYRLPLP